MIKKLIISTAVILVMAVLAHSLRESRAEVKRLISNIRVLTDSVASHRTKSGELMYVVSGLNLKLSEMKEIRKADLEEIKNLRIREKDLRGIVKTQYNTIGELSASLRDTVYFRDSVETFAKTFHYKDPYLDQTGIILKDSIHIRYVYSDSFILTESIKRKGWWIFKRKVGTEYKLKASNPNTTIKSFEVVKVKW